MTYCCGVLVRDGLVMIADTRTNAGLDNVSTFRKLHIFSKPGDRIMAIDGRDVNNSDDIDRAMQRSGHLVVIDVERAGRRLRLKIAPRALTPSEAQEYTVRSRRMLGIVEQRFILRPGTGANDVYIPRLSRRCRQRHLLR